MSTKQDEIDSLLEQMDERGKELRKSEIRCTALGAALALEEVKARERDRALTIVEDLVNILEQMG